MHRFLHIIILAVVLVSIKAADFEASTGKATTEALTSIITTTTSKPVNDCPQGWIFAGKLGCFYFNTNSNKVCWIIHIIVWFKNLEASNWKIILCLIVFLSQNGLSWIEAQGQCEILGGFLAELKTEEEHEFLKSIVTSYEVNERFTIE